MRRKTKILLLPTPSCRICYICFVAATTKSLTNKKKKVRNGLHAPFNIILRVLAFLLTIACGLTNCICLIHEHIWQYIVLIIYVIIQAFVYFEISDDFCAVYSDVIPIKILMKNIKKVSENTKLQTR